MESRLYPNLEEFNLQESSQTRGELYLGMDLNTFTKEVQESKFEYLEHLSLYLNYFEVHKTPPAEVKQGFVELLDPESQVYFIWPKDLPEKEDKLLHIKKSPYNLSTQSTLSTLWPLYLTPAECAKRLN